MTPLATTKTDQSQPILDVEVVERINAPGVWAVEAINLAGDGEIYLAVFSGPDAKVRAFEYAEMKYGPVKLN